MQFLWHNFDTLDSTQTKAHELISTTKYEKPMLITSDIQTAGYGTRGRHWESTEGNLFMTFCLIPQCEEQNYSIEAAKLMQKALSEITKRKITLKDPNDLMYHGKKCGGILSTWQADLNKQDVLCIGIGINCKNNVRTSQPTTAIRCDKAKVRDMWIDLAIKAFRPKIS